MRSGYGVTGRWPDFFRDMQYAQDQMSRLFRGLPLTVTSEFPPVNVWIGTDGAIVTAEVAGVKQDQLDISVYQNTVRLRGERDTEEVGEDVIVHRQERVTGPFARTLVLPFRIDGDGVAASFDRGVLSLMLPRPATDKPRQIRIGSSTGSSASAGAIGSDAGSAASASQSSPGKSSQRAKADGE